jgi:hypothetical protein
VILSKKIYIYYSCQPPAASYAAYLIPPYDSLHVKNFFGVSFHSHVPCDDVCCLAKVGQKKISDRPKKKKKKKNPYIWQFSAFGSLQ